MLHNPKRPSPHWPLPREVWALLLAIGLLAVLGLLLILLANALLAGPPRLNNEVSLPGPVGCRTAVLFGGSLSGIFAFTLGLGSWAGGWKAGKWLALVGAVVGSGSIWVGWPI